MKSFWPDWVQKMKEMLKRRKKAKTPANAAAKKQDAGSEPERSMFSEGFLGDLHKPGEEPQMYPELLEEHKKVYL